MSKLPKGTIVTKTKFGYKPYVEYPSMGNTHINTLQDLKDFLDEVAAEYLYKPATNELINQIYRRIKAAVPATLGVRVNLTRGGNVRVEFEGAEETFGCSNDDMKYFFSDLSFDVATVRCIQ